MSSTYEVSVTPNADGWSQKLEAQIGAPMRQLAEEFRRRFSDVANVFDEYGARLRASLDPAARSAADNLRDQLQRGLRQGLNGTPGNSSNQGRQQADAFADAFSRTVRTRLDAALRNLPEVKLNANSSDVDRTLAEIRAKLIAANENIKLGVNDKAALAEVEALRTQLKALSRDADIRVRVNAGSALAELEVIRKATADLDGRGGRIKRAFSGELFGDAFKSLATSVRTALPPLDGLLNRLSSVGDSIKGVTDQATAGVKSNPILGLASSNILVTAIAAALTTVGPLAAAASGGVLGLAGAAAAAVLAFRGLQNQMSQNVGYGKQLQTEFSGVMNVVDTLGEAVADAIGPGLVSSLARVREALPSFGGLFKSIGSQLGDVAGSLTTALLDVFRASGPVILQVVGYIKQGAQRLSEWTGSEGFRQFLAYAARELPVVGGFVASLGKALISAFVAFAPVGEVVLRVLTGIANIASGVFDAIGSVIDFFSGSGSPKANGPASQIAAMAAELANLGQITATVANTSSGMAAVFGVTDGAFKAASDAAASTASQLADTTLQMRLQNDAAGLLKASLDALSGKNLGVAQTLTSFQQGLLGIDNTFTKAAFSSTAFTDTAVAQRAELQQLVTAAQAHAEAVGQQTGSTTAATAALAADYAQILQNTMATGANRDAIQAYIDQIGAVPPVALTKIDVNTAFANAQVAAFTQMYRNLPPADVNVSVSLDGAAVQLQRFVQTPRTAYVQVSTVMVGQAPSGGRQALNAYGGIYNAVGHYAAGGIIDGLTAKMQARAAKFAQGSEFHVPQIAMPNGGVRIWAEPETQGEAYIPFAMDRRARAEDIVSQVAQRFGGAYVKPTTGAASAVSSGSASSGLVGVMVTIDAGSVGTLTGHITDVADGRIASSDAAKSAAARGGSSRVY